MKGKYGLLEGEAYCNIAMFLKIPILQVPYPTSTVLNPKKAKQKNSNPDEPKWTEKHWAAPNFDNSKLLQGIKS